MSDRESQLRRTWKEDGYICAVIEISSPAIGSWFCGYVGVPEDHFASGLAYDDLPIEVHGGLTFGPRDDLAHIDEDGEKPVVWFGWDYNHAADHRREVDVEEPVEACEDVVEQFQDLTEKDIVEHKIRWLPDEVLEKVKIEDVESN